MIRVTDGAIKYSTLRGLEENNSKLQALNEQMSTGRQITKPSDDPSGTVRALQLRADLKRNTQYAASAGDALGWMSTADSTYTQLVTISQKARTLTVQALNSGASTGDSNSAIGDEIDAIRSQMVSLANTTYNGRPIFGGTTTSTTAYTDNGDGTVSYNGDSGTVMRQVGDTTTVQINQNGPDVFGDNTAGTSVFDVLQNISNKLHDPTTYGQITGSDLDAIDAAVRTISTAQAKEGATYNRVTTSQAAQTTTTLALTSELSDIQDIDIAKQAVLVSTANVNYQAALQTTANIRQISLLDFLK